MEVKIIKQLANIVTLSRIPLAIAMLFTLPFSVPFFILYIGCGITDMIDGYIARKLNQESELGAKLDSIADVVFAVAVAIFVIRSITIPGWLWWGILLIAFIRFISYGIGFYKYHTFASLHTYANKFSGGMIFMTPILYYVFGLVITGAMLFIITFISSIEEMLIIIKSKELKRDCKSIFSKIY